MKRVITIVTLLFLSVASTNAQTSKETLKHSHKMKYEDFVKQYGNNDTALALIDVFFQKRDGKAATFMSFLPISAAIVPLNPLAGGMAVMVTTPLFVNGAIVRFKYNKRKLHKMLIEFENNGTLAKNMNRKTQNMLFIYELEEAEMMAMDSDLEVR